MTVKRFDDWLSMMTRGSTVKALMRCLRPVGAGDRLLEPEFAAQRLANDVGDALGPAALVLLGLELALDQNRVERHAVGGGEDLGARDVGAGRRTGAGDERQQARMIRRIDGEFGDGGEGIGFNRGDDRSWARPWRSAHAWLQLLLGGHAQPVGIVVARRIGLLLLVAPVRHAGEEGGLRLGHTRPLRDSAVCPPDSTGSASA